ncbi:MAG TPA: hypothetical protein VJ865_00650, partial [Gemmatimonadaceae bacterium]|nr:hypothetical protein [Gemmatimonadaceae bacterium]
AKTSSSEKKYNGCQGSYPHWYGIAVFYDFRLGSATTNSLLAAGRSRLAACSVRQKKTASSEG